MDNNERARFWAQLKSNLLEATQLLLWAVGALAVLGLVFILPAWISDTYGLGWGLGIWGLYVVLLLVGSAFYNSFKDTGIRLRDLFR